MVHVNCADDNTQFLVSAIVSCNALGVLIYSIIFTFILRGQRNVHQVRSSIYLLL